MCLLHKSNDCRQYSTPEFKLDVALCETCRADLIKKIQLLERQQRESRELLRELGPPREETGAHTASG